MYNFSLEQMTQIFGLIPIIQTLLKQRGHANTKVDKKDFIEMIVKHDQLQLIRGRNYLSEHCKIREQDNESG